MSAPLSSFPRLLSLHNKRLRGAHQPPVSTTAIVQVSLAILFIPSFNKRKKMKRANPNDRLRGWGTQPEPKAPRLAAAPTQNLDHDSVLAQVLNAPTQLHDCVYAADKEFVLSVVTQRGDAMRSYMQRTISKLTRTSLSHRSCRCDQKCLCCITIRYERVAV